MNRLTNEERKKIDIKLIHFLEQNNISLGYKEIDVIKIAKKMGFTVVSLDLDEGEEGFIIFDPESRKNYIGVNSKLPLKNKRFVIAHELGHYVLHSPDSGIFAHRENKKGKDKNEQLADYFAACLLMPQLQFSEAFSFFNNSLEKDNIDDKEFLYRICSDYFVVPLESVRRRVNELSLF